MHIKSNIFGINMHDFANLQVADSDL